MRRSVSQSFIISSNVNCTKYIAIISLILWFVCLIIFLSRNGNNVSNSDNNNNDNNNNKNYNDIQSLSYQQSLSLELTENGWKPIYIHSWNARMPIEEMDYLLEKYWYPNIKSLQKNEKDKVDKNNEEEILEEIINYPSDWKSLCFPSRIHDQGCIMDNHLRYWVNGVSRIKTKQNIGDKYVTFLKDCGGWNNIRQGFEFHAMIAWITERTLVIPPDIGWYLIDYGQMTRGLQTKQEKNKASWPNNKERRFGVSNFDIWFDLNDMSLAISVITTPEFIRREYESLNIPIEFNGGDIVNLDKNVANNYIKWLNDKATELNVNLPWGQLNNILYWPNIKSVESKNSKIINNEWIDNRNKREYTSFLKKSKFIHFPSCAKGIPGQDHDFRYLGQIARSIAFDTKEKDKKYKQILRDHIHLNSEIMEYASLVISILGAFNYASFHIRRNELQYKYVFSTANDSYNNVKPLIGKNEILYIATDEKKEDFFKVFKDGGIRKVYRWKDFFGDNAKFKETKNIIIPGKLHGEVEMVICAMSRIFFGTKESTFSQYIGVLRGYFDAPYTQTLYHHYKLTKDIDKSSKISKSNPGKPYRGQIYKIPFPDLWLDLK